MSLFYSWRYHVFYSIWLLKLDILLVKSTLDLFPVFNDKITLLVRGGMKSLHIFNKLDALLVIINIYLLLGSVRLDTLRMFIRLEIVPERIEQKFFLGLTKFKTIFGQLKSDTVCGLIELRPLIVLIKLFISLGIIKIDTLLGVIGFVTPLGVTNLFLHMVSSS